MSTARPDDAGSRGWAGHSVRLAVGGVNILVRSGSPVHPLFLPQAHARFAGVAGNPDLILTVCGGSLPDLTIGGLLFDSGGPWRLYEGSQGYIIALRTPPDNPQPYRLIHIHALNSEPVSCDLYVSSPQSDFINPFEYPTDELLMVQLLARKKGCILHACGLVESGKGILFCGVSGAGKSTMARIWMDTGVTILSDDRIIVRRMDGVLRMYGTPWHGDANVCDPGDAPLEKLFFIVHADHNYAKPISPVDAASRLLVRCFPPFYFRDGMHFVTDFLAQIAEEVPCYELGFVPDKSVVDLVRGML
ncbi:MAG: hypothetical protein ACUVTZ_10565 [Armatimonadota bacterium]